MQGAVIVTPRLYLRRMGNEDIAPLSAILQDKDVMYAYEHAFSDGEVRQWLDRQMKRYEEYDFGLWAVILRETECMIGQCGITMQEVPEELVSGGKVPEIGYLFRKDCWHKGYVAEAASACREYAFNVLGFNEIYSIIRDNNIPSQNVAKRNGMTPAGTFVKRYYGMDMPHILYKAERK